MAERARSTSEAPPPLINQVSRAAFWNAVLLPILGALNLVFSIVIRRRFGLLSGVYDILLGLMAAILQYSSIGIPEGLSKFLPELSASSGAVSLRPFLRHAIMVRLFVVGLILVPLNIFAHPIAQVLGLGEGGSMYLRLLSGLVVARSVLDLMLKAVNAFFAHGWSNSLLLAQAALDLVLVGLFLLFGYGIGGVFSGLLMSAAVVAIVSVRLAAWRLPQPEDTPPDRTRRESDETVWLGGQAERFFRYGAFSYLFGLTGFFTDMGFAAPVLAVVLAPDQVALFATAFKLAFMSSGLVVSVFRGLYAPLFARLRTRNESAQLQQAFEAVSKTQLAVLIPAGAGLIMMAGDYIPLLFGVGFVPSVAIAQVLVTLLFAATSFNLPSIILAVDERYRAAAWARSVTVLSAPLFVLAAAQVGLVGAAVVLGGARLVAALFAYQPVAEGAICNSWIVCPD